MYEFDLEKYIFYITDIYFFRDFSNTYEAKIFSPTRSLVHTQQKTDERKIALKLFHDDIKLHDFNNQNSASFPSHFPPSTGNYFYSNKFS